MHAETARRPGALILAAVAAGTFVCTVSFALFIHTISQLSSPGLVLRLRATTPVAQTIAVSTIVAGVVAAVASIALAAAGISGAP